MLRAANSCTHVARFPRCWWNERVKKEAAEAERFVMIFMLSLLIIRSELWEREWIVSISSRRELNVKFLSLSHFIVAVLIHLNGRSRWQFFFIPDEIHNCKLSSPSSYAQHTKLGECVRRIYKIKNNNFNDSREAEQLLHHGAFFYGRQMNIKDVKSFAWSLWCFTACCCSRL